jgi:hypothetical protein
MKQKTASDVLCVLKDRLAEYLPEADPDLDY